MNYAFAIISIAGFVITSGAAMFVFARNPREWLNQIFFAFSTVVGWNNLLNFLAIIGRSSSSADQYYKLSNVCWLVFVAVSLHFCVILARKDTPLTMRGILPIAYLSMLIMSYLNISTYWFYTIPQMTGWGYSASSRRDFINKVTIAKKEMQETSYWLKIITGADLVNNERNIGELRRLLQESDELTKILGAILFRTKQGENIKV